MLISRPVRKCGSPWQVPVRQLTAEVVFAFQMTWRYQSMLLMPADVQPRFYVCTVACTQGTYSVHGTALVLPSYCPQKPSTPV